MGFLYVLGAVTSAPMKMKSRFFFSEQDMTVESYLECNSVEYIYVTVRAEQVRNIRTGFGVTELTMRQDRVRVGSCRIMPLDLSQ